MHGRRIFSTSTREHLWRGRGSSTGCMILPCNWNARGSWPERAAALCRSCGRIFMLSCFRRWPGFLWTWWSLLLVKFHLAAGPFLVLAAGRRWRAIGAFACGAGALAAVNFGLSGREGAELYIRFLSNPFSEGLYPAPEKLACLQGLAANLPVPAAWTYVLAGLPVGLFALLAFRRPWRQSASLAQGGALYLTPHVYLYDWSVLTPALLLAAEDVRRSWVRGLSLLLLSPLSAAAFLLSPLLQAGVHAAYIAWLAAVAWPAGRRENQPEGGDPAAAS